MSVILKNLPKPNAVLFDLDGTLLDTADDLANALNILLAERSRKTIEPSKLRDKVSNGANALLRYGFGVSPDDEGFEDLRQAYLDTYLNNLATYTQPFPHIEDLITALDQALVPWGIVTNKPYPYAKPLMEQFEFAHRCQTLVCPDHVQQKKPHPEALFLACEQMKVDASSCVYVGDHRRDIACGNDAGAITIACAYGYLEPWDDIADWNADFVVQSGKELCNLIRDSLS